MTEVGFFFVQENGGNYLNTLCYSYECMPFISLSLSIYWKRVGLEIKNLEKKDCIKTTASHCHLFCVQQEKLVFWVVQVYLLMSEWNFFFLTICLNNGNELKKRHHDVSLVSVWRFIFLLTMDALFDEPFVRLQDAKREIEKEREREEKTHRTLFTWPKFYKSYFRYYCSPSLVSLLDA